ncbi:MAG: phospholipid/cholesterol/gamma-HCH transport system substrate-binding protein [Actinomycetota bacterium]|nr:phospholipid/cholesterol/gamma-HCH transport system substrate-binding protein [Actinomycetota bacterium]
MALSPSTRVKINLIAFLVLALGLSFAMATQVLSVLHRHFAIYGIFPDAGGVFTSQEVTYRGITVGQVGTLEVVPDGVKIQMLINGSDQIPAQGVQARVMFKSAVGEQFIELEPQSNSAPYLHQGSVIPLSQTSIPVSTQGLLTTLQAVLKGVPPGALKGAVNSLGGGLGGRGPDIATIIESSADLAQTFAQRSGNTHGLLANGTKLGGAFLASKADFERAIRELALVSAELAGDEPAIHELLTNANLSSDQVVALLTRYKKQIDQFLPKFAAVNALQAAHHDDLNRLLAILPGTLAKVNKAFESKTGLVRFGLVTDTGGPPCSYGTPRRPPGNRKPYAPPKHAHCKKTSASAPLAGTPQSTDSASSALSQIVGGSAGGLAGASEGKSIPSRLSSLSWTLFYLNGI